MCYSEELKREAGGFMVGDQWVLTGWKGMYVEGARVEEYTIPHCTPNFRFIMSPATGFKWEKTPAEPTFTYTTGTRLRWNDAKKPPRFYSMFSAGYTYEFGKVMTDGHGFHLAATLEGARGALSDTIGKPQHVYTKILALESAIEDNHAHVVMILEPGKDPTEEQIALIAKERYTKFVGKKDTMYAPTMQLTAPGHVTYASLAGSYGWVMSSGYSGSASLFVPASNLIDYNSAMYPTIVTQKKAEAHEFLEESIWGDEDES